MIAYGVILMEIRNFPCVGIAMQTKLWSIELSHIIIIITFSSFQCLIYQTRKLTSINLAEDQVKAVVCLEKLSELNNMALVLAHMQDLDLAKNALPVFIGTLLHDLRKHQSGKKIVNLQKACLNCN